MLGDSSRAVVFLESYYYLLAEVSNDQSGSDMDNRLATTPLSFPSLYFLPFLITTIEWSLPQRRTCSAATRTISKRLNWRHACNGEGIDGFRLSGYQHLSSAGQVAATLPRVSRFDCSNRTISSADPWIRKAKPHHMHETPRSVRKQTAL